MPTTADLLGSGMPPLQASRLGNTPLALTATGSTQADAAAILTGSHLVEMTATGADGIILSKNTAVGTPVFVFNSSGSTGLIYGPVGSFMNTGASASTAISLVTHKGVILFQYKVGYWFSILTA